MLRDGPCAPDAVGGAWYTLPVLCELRVENLLLIERAELRLGPGLNVLTGETGAGKTVLAGALDLLLGGRARGGLVRPGAAEALAPEDADAGALALLAAGMGALDAVESVDEELDATIVRYRALAIE